MGLSPVLPAVVGEGLVGFRHLVGIFATLHRGPEAIGCIENFVHETLRHRLFTTILGVAREPAKSESVA